MTRSPHDPSPWHLIGCRGLRNRWSETHRKGRGSPHDRRLRRAWLLSPRSGHGGNTKTVPCKWCRRSLDRHMLTVDRWPVAGADGGSYRHSNIVPACLTCNLERAAGT